jgi:mannose/fructose-specific phosphotransferase system component IIA
MIGIVIVTHNRLGDALIECAEFVIGRRSEALAAVSIDLNQSAETLRKKIADGIKKVDKKDGVIILKNC